MSLLNIGDSKVTQIGEITRTDFVKFAGAGGDFNPNHHDDEIARAAGFPSVFAMGMLTASLGSRLVSEWVGIKLVRSLEVRFKSMVWPGEKLAVEGTVARHLEQAGEKIAEIEFNVVNEGREVKLSGKAQVVR